MKYHLRVVVQQDLVAHEASDIDRFTPVAPTLTWSIIRNTNSIMFSTEFIIFNTKLLIFSTEFITFNTKSIILNTNITGITVWYHEDPIDLWK